MAWLRPGKRDGDLHQERTALRDLVTDALQRMRSPRRWNLANFPRFRLTAGLLLAFVVFGVCSAAPVAAQEISIAVVRDGDAPAQDLASAIEAELGRLLEAGRSARFDTSAAWTGAWDPASVGRALDAALADPSVTAVLVTGALGLQAAADGQRRLTKPVVSSVVLGEDLWGLPVEGSRSDRPNLVYLLSPNLSQREVESLLSLVPYRRLAVVLGREYAEHIETLGDRLDVYGASLGIDIRLAPLDPEPDSWAAAVAESTEVVLLAPAPRIPAEERTAFIEALIERKLPVFSLVGHEDVRLGALAALTPDISTQVVRRVALNLYEISRGTPPEELPVELNVPGRLLVNGRTLARLGVKLDSRVRTVAEVLYPEALDAGAKVLSLDAAMRQAEIGSATLSVSTAEYETAVHQVGRARSPLLPQLEATGSYLNLDPRTLDGFVPDEQAGAGIGLRQMIFDDSRVSDYRATGRLRDSAALERESVRLDVVSDAGRRFLEYVLSRILVRIQEENLRLTEENLALANRRFEVGYSGRDEVFRWEAQLADEQSQLLHDEAVEAAARIRLNQALGLPQSEHWLPEEIEIDPGVFPFLGGAVDDIYDDPRRWAYFEDLAVAVALENAPEVQGLGFAIDAQGIRLSQRKRSYIVPTLDFSARYEYVFHREPAFEDVSKDFHFFEVAARLPLLEGGLRLHDVRQRRSQLMTLERQQELVSQLIEERTRTAVHRTTNSFPVIRLSRNGAESSAKNLTVVRDKYAQGIVNVTDLLSAQNQSNVANQSAAAAIYNHVADLIELQRSLSWFDAERTPEERQELVGRIRESTRSQLSPVAPSGEE